MNVEYLSVLEAASIARLHPQTVSDALRLNQLHGTQRTLKGKWTIRRDCLEAWIEGSPCEHQTR
jgi:Helix-turn-helix domain